MNVAMIVKIGNADINHIYTAERIGNKSLKFIILLVLIKVDSGL